jgi:hypothetical protein
VDSGPKTLPKVPTDPPPVVAVVVPLPALIPPPPPIEEEEEEEKFNKALKSIFSNRLLGSFIFIRFELS